MKIYRLASKSYGFINGKIITYTSNLVHTTCLCNSLHQVRSKTADRKAQSFKSFESKNTKGLERMWIGWVLIWEENLIINNDTLFRNCQFQWYLYLINHVSARTLSTGGWYHRWLLIVYHILYWNNVEFTCVIKA